MTSEKQKTQSNKRPLKSGLLAVVACVFAIALTLTGVFQSFDRDLGAFRFSQSATPASQNMIFVGIDKASLDAVGVWPWPRSVHGQILDRLIEAGAEEVAIDIDFSAHSTSEQDALFADALRRADGRVILPVFMQKAQVGDSSVETVVSSPIEPIANAAWLGSVNVFPEPDGKIWSFGGGWRQGEEFIPSMPSLLAERSSTQGVRIDYGINAETVPVLSAAKLLDPDAQIGSLEGKKIVYGAYATELGDIFLTPVHGPMPGAMVQILAAETLLAGREIKLVSPIFPLCIIMIMAVLLSWQFRDRWGWWMSAILLSGLILELGAFSLYKYWALQVPTAASHVFIIASIFWRYVALNNLINKLMLAARADARLSRDQLEFLSKHDEDTGAMRRLAFLEECAEQIGLNGPNSSLAVFELSRMDTVSTALGHERAEQMAVMFYNQLKVLTPQSVVICRLAPFSFAIAFSAGSEEQLASFAEQIHKQLSRPVNMGGATITPNIKAGFTRCRNYAGDLSNAAEGMLVDAQVALNFAVQSGRKDFVVFDGSIDRQMRRNAIIEADLRAAIESDAMELHFQPIIDLATGKTVTFESLLRWKHPKLGRVPPFELVNIADAAGYAFLLDKYVLRKACVAAAQFPNHIAISVNIGPQHFEIKGFAELVMGILQETGLRPERLILEVLETAALGQSETLDSNVNKLRGNGISIALDDFGTGNAGFEHLARFPFDKVKLDKAFVQGIGLSKSKQAIVQATRKLCDAFGTQMICEGIETEEDRSLVRLLGCDMGQGYLFAKPLTLENAVASLNEHPNCVRLQESA